MRKIAPQGIGNLPSTGFRAAVGSAEHIAVIAHTDMDGLGAARIFKDSSFGPKISRIVTTDAPNRDITPDEEAQLLAANPDLIVFLDIAPSNFAQLDRLLSGRRGLVIDHHKPPKGMTEVAGLDCRFLSYSLFPQTPDRFSTTLLVAELIGEEYDAGVTVAALLGDENLKYFDQHFEMTADERRIASDLGVIYKKIGAIQPISPDQADRAGRVRAILEKQALQAPGISALHQALHANETVKALLAEISRDSESLTEMALAAARQAGGKSELLLEFNPTAGFFVSGFIYLLEKRVREEVPAFRGILIISQEGASLWHMDGLSTDPDRSIGELFSRSGIGGGHRNVGGGRLKKSDGRKPKDLLSGKQL